VGRRRIGFMEIANISDLADISDYAVEISEAGNPLSGKRARECSVYVRGHDRRAGVWALIARALEVAWQSDPAPQGPEGEGKR
jgi:hypothetical protein